LVASFPDEIRSVSATFVEVFNQAIAAEALGLGQLTGIGLRKALEFLVKDFAIQQKPAERAAIEQARLGVCINSYIDDPNVRACATRAAWLGNDEAHYLRKWEDRDIDDLKRLIRLTTNWVENVLLTGHYVENMKSGGASRQRQSS
jgi:hypothetical protein